MLFKYFTEHIIFHLQKHNILIMENEHLLVSVTILQHLSIKLLCL